jgi:probable HAF family extracellular repeat protein
MKSTLLVSISAVSLLAPLTMPARLAAQEQSAAQERRTEVRYTVIDLGSLGGTYSQAFYVNDKGVTSGEASLADGNWHAVLWQGPFKRDLGTLGGLSSSVFGSPNAIGQVVGASETSKSDPNGEDFCGFQASGAPSSGTCLGFLWDRGSMTPLPTLGGHNGAASMINNRGEVAGNAENTTPDSTCPPYSPAEGQYQVLQDKPVVWKNGQIEELPTYGGDPDGFAIAINDSGQVAGASGVCSTYNEVNGFYLSPVHALLWENGAVTDLGSLGGAFGNQAHNMNNRGQVVGVSDLAGDAVFHGFLWSQRTGMQDVPPLPGDTYSVALSINDAGQVGGVSLDATFSILRAFVVVNGAPTDLNTLIPTDSPLQLQTACAINSHGEIAGLAVEKSTGEYRGYLATPVGGVAPGH